MTHGRVRTGVVLALAYVVLAVAYWQFTENARPLFDGFAPPPPYNWVNPPKEFRSGNVAPKPASVDVALGPAGSAVGGGSTGDGQVIVSFPAGAFPPHPPDAKVVVQITPVDPAVLAPPPAGLLADGNAYRLEYTYDASKTQATALAATGDVFVVVPEPAQTLLFSPDGKAWENLPFRPVPDPTQIGGAVNGPGYLLAVAPPVGRPGGSSGANDESARVFKAVAAIAALALVMWLLPVGVRRLRGRPS